MVQSAQSASSQEVVEVLYIPKGCAAIQEDFDRLQKWADRNCMEFSERKYRVLHLEGKITPGTRQTGWKVPWRKRPWGSWRTPSLPWAISAPLWPRKLKASWAALDSVASTWREGNPSPLLCAAETCGCCVHCWAPQYERDVEILESIQQEAREMVMGLKTEIMGRGEELWVFRLEKKRLRNGGWILSKCINTWQG